MSYDRKQLMAELERDERREHKPYKDSEGYLTIGIGWNLDANPLPDEVIDRLLQISIGRAELDLDFLFPNWRAWAPRRQRALLNMAFNMGRATLAGFHGMRRAIAAGDWELAAQEAMDSKWARQVGARATRIEIALREG